MSVFEALDGKHWRQKKHWGSASVGIDKWYGVHVDGGGCIVKIDLRSNGLKGELLIIFSCVSDMFIDITQRLVFDITYALISSFNTYSPADHI